MIPNPKNQPSERWKLTAAPGEYVSMPFFCMIQGAEHTCKKLEVHSSTVPCPTNKHTGEPQYPTF